MTRWPYQLLLLLTVVAAASASTYMQSMTPKNKTTLTVGYLTALKGDLKNRQGLAISGAITLALHEVIS